MSSTPDWANKTIDAEEWLLSARRVGKRPTRNVMLISDAPIPLNGVEAIKARIIYVNAARALLDIAVADLEQQLKEKARVK